MQILGFSQMAEGWIPVDNQAQGVGGRQRHFFFNQDFICDPGVVFIWFSSKF